VLSPFGLESPVIFGRYLLPVVPWVLVWVAAAFGVPWEGRKGPLGQAGQGEGDPRLLGVAAGLFVIALLALGPFADPVTWRTSFLHHNDFVGFYKPRPVLPVGEVPEIYRRLHGETVVEFPWLFIWSTNHGFYLYQAIHGGRVIVASPQHILFRPPVALRNAVVPEPAAICGTGARYLIIHRAVAREEDRIAPGGRLSEGEMAQPLRRMLRQSAVGLGERVEAAWGPPVSEDPWVRVWDLRAVCGPGR
jgi:hypothetical protein